MKNFKHLCGFLIVFSSVLPVWAADFQGVVPIPVGKSTDSVTQILVQFPTSMNKEIDAFSVSCSPEIAGFGSWADNDTKWAYSFKGTNPYKVPQLPGGTDCQVTQVKELRSVDGKTWPIGTINYSFYVDGPKINAVLQAPDFNSTLRDQDPVILVLFDGDVNQERFFSENHNYLSYVSGNAPSEKILLAPVPSDSLEVVFKHFSESRYLYGTQFQDKNWILATVNQNLIPGADVNLHIEKTASAYSGGHVSSEVYSKNLKVRSEFSAKLSCASATLNGSICIPKQSIEINFNSRVKWADVSSSYIEYMASGSKKGQLIRGYPTFDGDSDSWFDSAVNILTSTFPVLSRISGKLVDSIRFDVDIEPETMANIVITADLKDIEGRQLPKSLEHFQVRVGSRKELIRLPEPLSLFERNRGDDLAMPIAMVNLHQKITIRKTGNDKLGWKPITDVSQMIHLINAYETRGIYRDTQKYVSPLEGFKTTQVSMTLSGEKNRATFIQVPFSKGKGKGKSAPIPGLYALEVSSPTYEAEKSDKKNGRYFNPPYTLAQVTDLAVNMKKGSLKTMFWVTSLSSGQPVPNAAIEIYNCLGQKVLSTSSDKDGLASVVNQEWASSCDVEGYSQYFQPGEFYVVARTPGDFVLAHSSWSSSMSYAFFSPGVDYFYSSLEENTPYFHGIVGVNLVKPGQTVPIEIVARWPRANGFMQVPSSELPVGARIFNSEDPKVFYEFPLTWNSDRANLSWSVPSDSSVKLGNYSIELIGPHHEEGKMITIDGGIEVAEFKIPLMTGILSLPADSLVKPQTLPVNGIVRYANGVGAKDLDVELSYYFEPTYLSFNNYENFNFGSGKASLESDHVLVKDLPDRNRPETISGVKTKSDGSINRDLALETLPSGKTVGGVLAAIDRPQKLVTRMRYRDQMGEFQTVSQGKDIFNSSSFVGAKFLSDESGNGHVQVVVVDVNGKSITSLSDLDFSLYSVESTVIGEELFGGLIKNTVERNLKPLNGKGQKCQINNDLVVCDLAKRDKGSYAFQVSDKKSGQAAHVFFKVDKLGRFYGDSYYYNEENENSQKGLPLALDKALYKDGDKAIVSFSSPFKSCTGLVTIERSDVMESFISKNACENGFVEVPVKANLAPNGFVSVYIVTGRSSTTQPSTEELTLGDLDLGKPTYRLGFANLKVDWAQFMAQVQVKTDKEKYQPRETVNVNVSVNAEQGQLGVSTVTLIALEEKILQLKANDTYKILDAMMQLRGHNVTTVTPFEKIQSAITNYSAGDYVDSANERKGGDEGGDGSSNSEFKRQLFDALVTFQSDIPVIGGVARATFKANDNLTSFKVFAVVSSSQNKFGLGETRYLSEKDTQSYSNIPLVAYSGDQFPVQVTLQNNTSADQKYRTEVSAIVRDGEGKEIGRFQFGKTVGIDKNGSVSVNVGDLIVPDKARKVEYAINVYDDQGRLVDQLSPEPQTVFPSVPLAIHHSYLRQVDENGALQLQLDKEKSALADEGEIRASISSSLVKGAHDQIRQKVAQDEFADFFAESRIYKALLEGSPDKSSPLKKALSQLIGQLDENGFVKYYPQASRGDLWLTASIINLLQSQSWAMKAVPPALLDGWKNAIRAVLTKSIDPDYVGTTSGSWLQAQAVMGVAAFAFGDQQLEALSRRVAQEVTIEIAANSDKVEYKTSDWKNSRLVDVWLFEVFALPETAFTSPRFQQLAKGTRLTFAGNGAKLVGEAGFLWSSIYSDSTLETAKLLYGISRLHGDSDLARSLAQGLVNASTDSWYGFRTIAWVSAGLNQFGASFESQKVNGDSTVDFVEAKQSQRIDWTDKVDTLELAVPWQTSQETVRVNHKGEGLPWVSVQGLTAVPLDSSYDQGINIEKKIRNVTNDQGSDYHPGDIVEVTLRINSASSVYHVVLQDPIPAGSNIVGEAYGYFSSGEKSYRGYKLYFSSLSQGVTEVKYQYQLNNPGVFKLPPTRAEGIYVPSIYGETPNAVFSVK